MEPGEHSVRQLVAAAIVGEKWAWDALVVRYHPLIMSVTGKYRLPPPDAADVAQTVWMSLLQNLEKLRNPDALPGWIVTTTRNECSRALSQLQTTTPCDPSSESAAGRKMVSPDFTAELTDDLLQQQRHEALLAAFAELPDQHRRLLELLMVDPPLKYAKISEMLDIPVGSIGPTRSRILDRLRRTAGIRHVSDPDQ